MHACLLYASIEWESPDHIFPLDLHTTPQAERHIQKTRKPRRDLKSTHWSINVPLAVPRPSNRPGLWRRHGEHSVQRRGAAVTHSLWVCFLFGILFLQSFPFYWAELGLVVSSPTQPGLDLDIIHHGWHNNSRQYGHFLFDTLCVGYEPTCSSSYS
jgi:hypothetical protein